MSYNTTYTPTTSYSPTAPRSTKPAYNSTGISTNSYVAANTPTYISSPFDDDPIPPANNYNNNNYNNNSLEKSSPTSYDNTYNPSTTYGGNGNSSTHYNQNHSPSMAEKGLAGGASSQTYAMEHVSNNTYNNNNNNSGAYHQNDNSNYYNGYDEDRPSLSNDTAPMRPYADMETSEGLTRSKSGVTRVKYGKQKSKCLPCFPCIHSTCGRVTCCFCLILLLGIIALVIVIFTVFKLPEINYQGMQGEPQFAFNQGDTTLAVNLVANIQVKNPNPIGFNFEAIVATAYYPNYAPSIGGGNLTHVDFPSKTTKVINFPISARYSGAQDKGYVVVNDILHRCGVLGGENSGLTINYDLKLSFKIIGITISPTIKNQHVNVACPANIQDIVANIPGGLSGFS